MPLYNDVITCTTLVAYSSIMFWVKRSDEPSQVQTGQALADISYRTIEKDICSGCASGPPFNFCDVVSGGHF